MDYEKYLALAVYKMGEMLNVGKFEPAHKENFECALAKIKDAINESKAA